MHSGPQGDTALQTAGASRPSGAPAVSIARQGRQRVHARAVDGACRRQVRSEFDPDLYLTNVVNSSTGMRVRGNRLIGASHSGYPRAMATKKFLSSVPGITFLSSSG